MQPSPSWGFSVFSFIFSTWGVIFIAIVIAAAYVAFTHARRQYYVYDRKTSVRDANAKKPDRTLLVLLHSTKKNNSRWAASICNMLLRQADNPLSITVAVYDYISGGLLQDASVWYSEHHTTAIDHTSQICLLPESVEKSTADAHLLLLDKFFDNHKYVVLVSDRVGLLQGSWDTALTSLLDREPNHKNAGIGSYSISSNFVPASASSMFGKGRRHRFTPPVVFSAPPNIMFPRVDELSGLVRLERTREPPQVPIQSIVPPFDLFAFVGRRPRRSSLSPACASELDFFGRVGIQEYLLCPTSLVAGQTVLPSVRLSINDQSVMGVVARDYRRDSEIFIKYGSVQNFDRVLRMRNEKKKTSLNQKKKNLNNKNKKNHK